MCGARGSLRFSPHNLQKHKYVQKVDCSWFSLSVFYLNFWYIKLSGVQCDQNWVKVEVVYQQVIKLTQNYDFYDFPMPVYARKSIYIKNLGDFGYTDTHFTWQNPTNLP